MTGVNCRQERLNICKMTTDSLNQALEAAETHCLQRGEKLTPVRRRVLELVLSSTEDHDAAAAGGGAVL